uniref:MEF2BNB-like protein n=1 Tax=Kalanchoe fedtschenkoi TaxID=63787 RepID=A0A7N0V3S1_KALFE
MHEFSTVDGFVEISESLGEMIKYLANEPSVGLFYVQQHTQNAVPNIIKLKNKTSEKAHETALHTEDLEDSIVMVRSMKECGSHIIQGMMGDINKTLAIMSVKEPRRGVIRSQGSSFSMGKGTSWGPSTWGRSPFSSPIESGRSSNYISTVFKSAKEKASNLKWPPLDLMDPRPSGSEEAPSASGLIAPVTATSTSSSLSTLEHNDLPVSGLMDNESQEETSNREKIPGQDVLLLAEEYDEFKADREAKLREWLEGNSCVRNGNDENST